MEFNSSFWNPGQTHLVMQLAAWHPGGIAKIDGIPVHIFERLWNATDASSIINWNVHLPSKIQHVLYQVGWVAISKTLQSSESIFPGPSVQMNKNEISTCKLNYTFQSYRIRFFNQKNIYQ